MKNLIVICCLLVFAIEVTGQKVFAIWPGTAPGSESWSWHEEKDSLELPGDLLVYNVVKPVLTFFPADPAMANGTSVIICPGGSFCYLHVNTEGADVARWLNKKGIAAFVLRYRLVHSETNMPIKEKKERSKDTGNFTKLVAPLLPLAIADAGQALSYVRKHATEFGISASKIGILGFSAGGTLTVASSLNYSAQNRPDFVASIYAYIPPSMSAVVPKDAPPVFISAATDDGLVMMSVNLYGKWVAAGHPAEIHIYSKGGHGFGMKQQQQPSDTWIDRFGDWLQVQGLCNNQ